MDVGVLDIIRELTVILKDGGPYAVAAVFILLYIRTDRYSKRLASELKELAVAQVEGGVESRMTMGALKDAMSGVEVAQIEVRQELSAVVLQLSEIKGMKERKFLEKKNKE